LKFNWWNTVKTSDKIIAISNFVRSDILEHYKVPSNRVITIYNAVVLDIENILPFEMVGKKFGIDIEEYFYTVSSMAPHKNLTTLIHVMAKLKKENLDLPKKLVITGIGGSARQTLIQLIEDFNLVDNIILTGFIETAERNTLYKYCHTFLFPSIFEGFGFPPVEAMMFGRPVVTTNIPCLREVTLGYAQYVEDPYSVDEWCRHILVNNLVEDSKSLKLLKSYNARVLVSQLIRVLTEAGICEHVWTRAIDLTELDGLHD
jgi:glycosyltransferase involved in cell wall biosynthesis